MKKMYAKFSLASRMMIVIFMLLLVGCGRSKTDLPSDAPFEQIDETYTKIELETAEVNEIEDVSIDSIEEDKPVTITKAGSFSEGIAWIKYIDTDGIEQIGWLHTDGHIDQPFPVDVVNQLSENYPSWPGLGSMFSGGYSCINTGDAFTRGASETPDRFLIFNSKGEITTQSPGDGNSYQILCGSKGLYLVKQSTRNMMENTDKYGIIDAAGLWIVPCTECTENGENPFSPKGEISRERKELGFAYCGEGVFLAYHGYGPYEQHIVFYNAKTGAIHQMDQEIEIIGTYYDSKIPVKIDGKLFIMSADFELTPIPVNTCNKVIYNEGIILAADVSQSGNKKTTLENAKFYKTDGSVLVDLSQYHLIYENAYELYRFKNGYAAVIIAGADGDMYLCMVNKDGEFTFEPKNISMPASHDLVSTFSGGVIVCARKDNSFSACIVDIDGNEIQADNIERERINEYVFCDGYAYDEKNLCFIGTDGNPLELYIGQ